MKLRRSSSAFIGGKNRSQAPVIPPPSRYKGKLKTLISVASRVPSEVPAASYIILARSLPPVARWKTSSAERSCPRLSKRAIAETVVAEAYFSAQPRLPQPHG